MPSGLARPSIHPSAQLCLQITPSLLIISPAKLYISVIVSKKPARLQLEDGKETSHQDWEGGKTARRQQSRGHAAHPKTRFIKLSKGVEEDVFTSLLSPPRCSFSTLEFPGVVRNRGSFQTQIPHFYQRIKQQVRFNLPSSNTPQGRVGNTEDPTEFKKDGKERGKQS